MHASKVSSLILSLEADFLEVVVMEIDSHWLEEWQHLLSLVGHLKLHLTKHGELKEAQGKEGRGGRVGERQEGDYEGTHSQDCTWSWSHRQWRFCSGQCPQPHQSQKE